MTNAAALSFAGFGVPEENWSRLPHALIEALPIFTSLAELKVVLYILRHTWGFKEFGRPKHMTLDELQNGRKRDDGSRMDHGTGMVKSAVIDGVKKAAEHGFLAVLKNDRDKGRKERHYALRMFESQTSDVAKSNISGTEVIHRTEKETESKKPEKETLPAAVPAPVSEPPLSVQVFSQVASAEKHPPQWYVSTAECLYGPGGERAARRYIADHGGTLTNAPPDGVKPIKPLPVIALPHIALIDAYYEGIPERIRPKPNYRRNVRTAKDILADGFTAEQVKAFVTDRYKEDYWLNLDSIMSLEHVKTNIRLFLSKENSSGHQPVSTPAINHGKQDFAASAARYNAEYQAKYNSKPPRRAHDAG